MKDFHKHAIVKDFDVHAEGYYQWREDSHSFSAQKRLVLQMLDGIQGRILDVGCGPANLEHDLLDLGFTVYGLDISEKMIAAALQEFTGRRFDRRPHLLAGDSERLPFRDSAFDAVVSMGALEYMLSYKKTLQEINRVLKHNGTMIVTLQRKWSPYRILGSPFIHAYKLLLSITSHRGTSQPLRKSSSYRRNFVVPSLFERQLEETGFRKVRSCCCNFAVIPQPFDRRVPTLSVRLSEILEPLCSLRILGWFGTQYLIKAVKISS